MTPDDDEDLGRKPAGDRGAAGPMTVSARVLTVVLAVAVLPVCAAASPTSISRGQRLAQANCVRCHTLSGSEPSPLAGAPPFPELQRIFPARNIEEIFADALLSDHPKMPFFVGYQDQRQDLLDYIRSVQRAPSSKINPPRPAF